MSLWSVSFPQENPCPCHFSFYNSSIGKMESWVLRCLWRSLYCLFCLCGASFSRWGRRCTLFVWYLLVWIYLFNLLFSPAIGFVSFSLLFVVILSFIWFHYVGCVCLKCFLVLFWWGYLGVVSSLWKMLHLCIVNVSEVIIKTVFIH